MHGLSDNTANQAEVQEAPGNQMSVDELNAKIRQKIQQDAFMNEQTPDALPWKELGDPEGIFAMCSSADEIQQTDASITKRIGHSKTAIAAVKRTMKDAGIIYQIRACGINNLIIRM